MLLNRSKWMRIQELQKGTHVMSRIHKPLEDIIVYLLYDLEFVGADHISIMTYILAFATAYLMLIGNLPLALLIAFLVGILDGVDGKIARLRQKKTLIGKLEHSFDMLYEQAWYASFTVLCWMSTGNILLLALGLVWLILDSYVRHIYHIVWITTGKSLKYHSGIAELITKIDGRRSVYVLHMIIWFLLSKLVPQLCSYTYAIYTILGHCFFTALSYTIISFRILHRGES
ncbi:MAG: hypothetical protein DRN53_04560 [Thermoprotei archaeon]|nr:MAG: hypothetical protein DRN53_04560 [Thermoprotei archaeon]